MPKQTNRLLGRFAPALTLGAGVFRFFDNQILERCKLTTIKIKRVYEKEAKSDGFRVLVDRLWPRGIKKEDLHFDLWEKDITPSPELRSWYHEDIHGHWTEFVKKYRKELEQSDAVDGFLSKIAGHKTVTLLYAAKDENQNHALVLKEFLETLLSREK